MQRRLLLSLALAGALVSVPLGAQQGAATAAKAVSVPYTMFTLKNGLTVILHEDHSVPVASVNVWYKVGSANEKPGRTGFAHLFEHLMFEGSGHVKEGDFDNFLEAAGGSNNANTDNDYTDYYIDVPSNAIDLALFLESDRLGYLLDVVTPGEAEHPGPVDRGRGHAAVAGDRADLRLNLRNLAAGIPILPAATDRK